MPCKTNELLKKGVDVDKNFTCRQRYSYPEFIDEDLVVSDKGGVTLTSSFVVDGKLKKCKIRDADARQIMRRSKAKKWSNLKLSTTERRESMVKKKQIVNRGTKETTNETPARNASRLKTNQSDLDSVVKNIKDSGVESFMDAEAQSLKDRIIEMQQIEKDNKRKKDVKEEDTKRNVTPEPLKPDTNPSPSGATSTEDEPSAQVEDVIPATPPEKSIDNKSNSLDEYLNKVVSLPKSEDGQNIANAMKPFVKNMMVKGNVNFTQDEMDKILQIVEHESIDFRNIAAICPEKPSTQCPHLSCPFKEVDKYPTKERCPIELAYIDKLIRKYMEEVLIDDDDVLGLVEYNLIVSLVDCDLTDIRIRGMLSQLGYLVDDLTANPKTGDKIVNKKINPILELMKANDKRKNSVLRQLLATPEIKERLEIKKKDMSKSSWGDMAKEKKMKQLADKIHVHKEITEDNE